MKIWLPVIYLTCIYEDRPVNILTIAISLKTTIHKLGECCANPCKRIQLKTIRLSKEYPLVYKFTGQVGPLTVAIEHKSLRCIFVYMLFLNLIFYFPFWCTDSPKIVNLEPEVTVVVLQNVILNCEAEGNPPPTYTWTPCDPEEVCDNNALVISQVINDANYTRRDANVFGDD